MKNYLTGITWMFFCVALFCSCSQPPHLTADAGNNSPSNLKSQNSISFLLLGDWGRNGSFYQKSVAYQMRDAANKEPIDFVFSMGDNFYPAGVNSTDDAGWRESFEDVYSFKSLNVPWYTVFGNHDYAGSIQAQLEYGNINQRWATKERYYSFEKEIPGSANKVLFVFIDTNPFDPASSQSPLSDLAKQDTAAQLKWIEKVLSSSAANWKIVIGHNPLFTTGARKSEFPFVRRILQPLFTKYQVDAYFSGHEHDLQYQKPEGPTHYFVSGAGSQVRPLKSNESYTRFAASSPGFISAQLMKDTMDLQFINYKGLQLFKTSITK
jgi:tartrate-resistant acid phosphatase type 5